MGKDVCLLRVSGAGMFSVRQSHTPHTAHATVVPLQISSDSLANVCRKFALEQEPSKAP